MHFGFVMMVDLVAAVHAFCMVVVSPDAARSSSAIELISVLKSDLERISSYFFQSVLLKCIFFLVHLMLLSVVIVG